jgi:plastocyanin
MRRGITVLSLVVLPTLVMTACGEPNPDREPGPKTLEGFDFEADQTIAVDENGFSPAEVTVRSGEVIEVRNEGDEPHTFTADGGRFETGSVEPGEVVTVVLDEPGRITYHDALEPDHEGVIVVEPATP